MDEYKKRKAHRAYYFNHYIKGWRQRECSACAGSGYYDNDGSPPCGACDGTGKERYKYERGIRTAT